MVIKSKSLFKSLLMLAALSLLILSIFPTMSSASTSSMYEKGALTSKPPGTTHSNNDIGIYSTYQFLFDMVGGLADNGNGTATISGHTKTNQIVSNLEVSLRLERWTGTQWVSASNTYVFVESDDNYVYGNVTLSVSKGYYYRTISTHKAKNGTITETHIIQGADRLIPL